MGSEVEEFVKYKSKAPAFLPEPDIVEPEFPAAPENTPGVRNTGVIHLRLLWRTRKLLFRSALYGCVASVLIAFLIPPRFKSTTRLMPPESGSSSGLAMAAAALTGRVGGGLADTAGEMLGLKSTSDSFVGILNSRTVADHLISRFDLRRVYRDRRIEDARKDLADRTSISVDRKSQIIEITVTDNTAPRAAAIAASYVEELNRLVAQLSTSSARRERMFLEQRLQAVNQDLESAEKEFSQFSSKNTAIDIKEQSKAMVDAAATLQGELIADQSQLEGLRQIYNDNNVRVRSLRARISELQIQLQKLGGADESTAASQGQQTESLYPSIRKLPLLGVPYADLYRRTKIQEAIYETLTQEYELAKVQEAKEIPTVKVLDEADLPEKRSFPPRLVIILSGTAFAISLAAFFIIACARWEIMDASHPGKQLVLEVGNDVTTWISARGRAVSVDRLNKRFWMSPTKTHDSSEQQ